MTRGKAITWLVAARRFSELTRVSVCEAMSPSILGPLRNELQQAIAKVQDEHRVSMTDLWEAEQKDHERDVDDW